MILCPSCQHKELPGALFCSECGTQLISIDYLNTKTIKKTPSEALGSVPEIPELPARKAANRDIEISLSLHIVDCGQILHLHNKRDFTLGRVVDGQPILPEVDLSAFDAFGLGVSRLHAALRIVKNEVVVSDLGSSNGTRLNGQRIVPHVDYPVNHGDIVSLGKMKVQVLINH